MAAVLQRTVKRAPKLACCPSISSMVSKIETKPIDFQEFDDKCFSSDSKWWIQSKLLPDYYYVQQSGLSSEQQVNSRVLVENQDVSSINSMSSKGSYEFVEMGSNGSHDMVEKCDGDRVVHTGLEPPKMECGGSAVWRGGSQRDKNKSKVLEALCHAQTRARKAEIEAKKASVEKEHAMKLVFRQASQLFAYRQWVYVLQLENLCYQNKNKTSTEEVSSVIRVSPSKNWKLDENSKKVAPAKRKRSGIKLGLGRYKHDLGKFAVVFVVGLGIVGAGLVLGWSIGWMLI